MNDFRAPPPRHGDTPNEGNPTIAGLSVKLSFFRIIAKDGSRKPAFGFRTEADPATTPFFLSPPDPPPALHPHGSRTRLGSVRKVAMPPISRRALAPVVS